METQNEIIIKSLQRTSDVILGFVVLQSIQLTYKLDSIIKTLREIPLYRSYIVVGQICILTGSIIGITYYSIQISKYMDRNTNKLLNSDFLLIIKIALIIYFGIIPVLIILGPRLPGK